MEQTEKVWPTGIPTTQDPSIVFNETSYLPGTLNDMVANLTSQNMPWNHNSQGYMFDSFSPPISHQDEQIQSSKNNTMETLSHDNTSSSSPRASTGLAWKKRKQKSDNMCTLPRKMYISEEKMADYMKNLYIGESVKKHPSWFCSSQEEARRIVAEIDSRLSVEDEEEEMEEINENHNNKKTDKKLEISDLLKKEMRTWPRMMLDRKPCMEVVLWKCPSSLIKNIEETEPKRPLSPVTVIELNKDNQLKLIGVPRSFSPYAEIEIHRENDDIDDNMEL